MINEVLRSPRARIAGAVIFVAGIASACGTGGATETNKPTIIPTEKPTTSTMVTPTPEASPSPEASGSVIVPTPSATETPTATATPEVSPFAPKSIAEVPVAELPKDITPAQLKTLIEKSYKANPQAEGIWKEKVALSALHDAQFGAPGDAQRFILQDRLDSAYIAITKLDEVYVQTQDPAFYTDALDFWSYALANIPTAKDQIGPKLP